MHPYGTGLHGPTGERKSSNTTKILKKAETRHRCAHALTYIKSTQSMHQFETGLHQLEKTNSSNTTKILKKAEMSPYETDMLMPDIHKDPTVHMKQTTRAVSPCTSWKNRSA